MGKRGDKLRAAKPAPTYRFSNWRDQLEMLRAAFKEMGDAGVLEHSEANLMFAVAGKSLERRVNRFYGFDNKYDGNGRRQDDA